MKLVLLFKLLLKIPQNYECNKVFDKKNQRHSVLTRLLSRADRVECVTVVTWSVGRGSPKREHAHRVRTARVRLIARLP